MFDFSQHVIPYWTNDMPQSSSLCRPLRMKFVPETKEQVIAEKEQLDEEIRNLESIQIQMADGMTLIIHFDVQVSSIDGKILCYFTDTSTQVSRYSIPF